MGAVARIFHPAAATVPLEGQVILVTDGAGGLGRCIGALLAQAVRFVLTQPAETVIPELMMLPLRESSWS